MGKEAKGEKEEEDLEEMEEQEKEEGEEMEDVVKGKGAEGEGRAAAWEEDLEVDR